MVFDQPGRSSATLNRVRGAKPSVIEGVIRAPGTVAIQNGAGVLFTGSARVDVGSLVASSQAIDADYFERTGNFRIGGGELPGARVVNEGELTIGETDLAALVGREVANSGAIVAERGTVALASGERTTIDMAGDGLFQIAVDGDAPDGSVSNGGVIDSPGGEVVLTAGCAAGALDSVINTSGLVRASSNSGSGGRVVLSGRGGGEVRVAGRVEATGDTQGGEIRVTGETVRAVSGAVIDASGLGDGGEVLIGGDCMGAGDLRRASETVPEFGAEVRADDGSGAGGTVVAWADGSTWVGGGISATGGTQGGLVETSGKDALGVGSGATVSPGAGGQWLLDPRNVEITGSGGNAIPPSGPPFPAGPSPYRISAASISQALNNGSAVTVTTVGSSGPDAGDITVSGGLSWGSASTLRLVAANDVAINAVVNASSGSFGAVAAQHLTLGASVFVGDQGTLTFEATNGDLTLNGPSTFQGGDFTATAGQNLNVNRGVTANGDGAVSLTAAAGNLDSGDSVTVINGDLTAFAGGDLTSAVGLSPSGDGSVSLTADTGDMTLQGPVSVINGDLTARAGGSLDAQQALTSNGTAGISVTADTGGVDLGGVVKVINADFTALAAGDVTASGDIRATGTGSLDIEARSGSIDLQAPVDFIDGALTVLAGQDILARSALKSTGTGSVTAIAGGDLDLLGPVQFIDGDATAFVGGDATVSGGMSSSGTGTVLVTADRFFVGSAVNAAQVTMEADTSFELTSGGSVIGSGVGDAVVISASQRYANANGANAIRVTNPNSRWLLYIDTFAGNEGAEPGPKQPDLYGRPYRTFPPPRLAGFPGNRIVYGQCPVLTITGETLTKTYGTAVAALSWTDTGLRPGDTLAGALSSGPTVTSAGQPAGAPVGGSPYPTVVSATASSRGYVLNLVDGALTVNPAP